MQNDEFIKMVDQLHLVEPPNMFQYVESFFYIDFKQKVGERDQLIYEETYCNLIKKIINSTKYNNYNCNNNIKNLRFDRDKT